MTVTGVSSCGLLPRRGARRRFLAAAEDFDDAHRAAAAGARLAQGERCGLARVLRFLLGRTLPEQVADAVDGGLACRAGQQAIVPDSVEPVWQDMDQDPADELWRDA